MPFFYGYRTNRSPGQAQTRVIIYIDGLNLYYGAARGRRSERVEARSDAQSGDYPYKFRTHSEAAGQLNENKSQKLVPGVGVEPT